ncbi:MBL fold metallo-hydrolase [Neolewinella persica]|uniref:MBL fold metallo-hydrolase n=1 Tax=Neolewinella persica TaxID=70998 RepID=UPI0003713972|nr:MBL fold metallo-hydrolase [Neolewinella persica]
MIINNPALPFHPAKPIGWTGNPFEGKEFKYDRDPFRPDWSVLLRMIFSRNPQRAEKKADTWTPPVATGVGYLENRTENWIVWLGHACFLFQFNGVRFLVDPQLTDMPLVPRRVFPPFTYEEIRDVDYLLFSHDHRDHVDEKCIRAICKNNPIRKVLCPLKLSSVIGKWVEDIPIEEAGWYQIFETGTTGVRITFLPSRHWCRRGLTDFNRVLWGSFMLEVQDLGGAAGAEEVGEAGAPAGHTIYFGGDSAKTSYWKEIGDMFPDIDVAMLGIGAYKPDYMMQENHASPEEAHRGFLDLGAKRWWPMHHGTYDLSNEPASEPITWATELMAENGMVERLVQPAVGEAWWF